MTGHTLGAAGAIESIFCIKSINDGVIPPTINLINPDPLCDLNYTPLNATEKDVSVTMNNSFGFGGTNSTLVFKKI
jgi:3-oxoacyl-(acyl-carrier-protein) synthase